MVTQTDIEKFEKLKTEAWNAYAKLQVPCDAAYRKFEQVRKQHQEAVLYEKVTRKVFRDLINSGVDKINSA